MNTLDHLRIYRLRSQQNPGEEKKVEIIGKALESIGFMPRATLKEKWAGHWTLGQLVVIAAKTPNYSGWYASFSLNVGPRRVLGTTDTESFIAELSKHL